MRVEFQRKQLEFPSAQFGYLRDSTEALDDIDELRRRIAADGYLFIRGLIDRNAVLKARRVVLEHLREQHALVDGTPLMEGVMPRAGRSAGAGRTDVDRDRTEGWFSEDPEEISSRFGGRWLTADVRAGDIVTLGLYTLHGSTTNTTNRFRISCDVRFQPASEPMDERWAGRSPGGHYASALIPMAESRKRWGL